MANEKQELVLEINVQRSIDGLASLRKEMDELIKTRQDLADKSKSGDLEATKEIEKVSSAVRNLQTEYKAQQRVLDGYNASVKKSVDTNDFNNNSIETNRDLLKQLTAQYISLKSPSEAATKQIKTLSDKLKEQEAAIGNTSRNVGNYKESFQQAAASLPGFGTAMKGVNAVMDANPVGLLVIAFTSLAQLLGQNAEVADQLTFAAAAFTKVFSKLADDAVKVGKALFDIFTHPQKAINSLIESIETNLTNRFKAFGVIASGLAKGDLKAVGNGFTQLATGVTNLSDKIQTGVNGVANYAAGLVKVGKEGFEASKAMDDLVEKQAEFNGQAANYQKQADGLVKTLKDTTQEFSKRKEVAGQVADLEIKATNELVKGKQAELDAEKLSLKGIEQTAQQKANIRSLELELVGLNIDKENALKFKQTRINNLLGKEEVAAAKNSSDAKLNIKVQELKSLEPLLAKEAELKAKQFDDETNRELDAQVKAEQIRANRIGSESALVDAEIMARKRSLQNLNLTETEKKNIISESEDRIAAIKKKSAGVQSEAIIQMANDEKSIYEGVVSFISSTIEMIGQAIQQQSKQAIQEDTEATNVQKENLKNLYESKKISKEEYDEGVKKADAELSAKTKEENKKAWEANQAIQITMAVINTAQAIIAQLSNPTPYVGFVLSALAAVTGAAQIAIIASQQPPKFARGVIGLDGEGTSTSDSIDAKLSKGESVVTAKATQRFHRELAYMEMAVGNTPNYQFGRGKFASGFIPSPNVVTTDGGFVARDISRSNDNSAMIQNAIKNGFALAPAPQLSIVEFQNKQDSRNRSVNISEA